VFSSDTEPSELRIGRLASAVFSYHGTPKVGQRIVCNPPRKGIQMGIQFYQNSYSSAQPSKQWSIVS
jgi:hypothetical protein